MDPNSIKKALAAIQAALPGQDPLIVSCIEALEGSAGLGGSIHPSKQY